MSGCIFCKIANGEFDSEKIFESDNFFAIKDKFPSKEGHSLIISKKHFETVLDLPSSLGQEFLDVVKEVSLKVMKEVGAEGFNLMQNNFKVAGQVVPHLHFHIIPRKEGDPLELKS